MRTFQETLAPMSDASDAPVLTSSAVRALQLAAQGLLTPPKRAARASDVVPAIARMGVLQIDTIHVVARSPYLVLFSRLGAFAPSWLDDALARGEIFECWAHEACFAPTASFPILRRHQLDRTGHWSARLAKRLGGSHARELRELVEHIRANGAVKAIELGESTESGGFWQWKLEKRLLEALFATGEVMIARRERFQRVYDVAERVVERMGHALETLALPTVEQTRRALLLDAVRALGAVRARHVADYYRASPKATDDELAPLVAEGALLRARVRGREETFYVHASAARELERAARGELRPTVTTLLSPFDPIVWDRERALEMFDFDYRLECYTPAPKRAFGYYALPILHRGRLVGRLDAKAHRADAVFEVKALRFEEGVVLGEKALGEIARAIDASARWHATPRVVLGTIEPRGVKGKLERALRAVARVERVD